MASNPLVRPLLDRLHIHGARVKRAVGGKLAVRHLDCGALNEIAPAGKSDDGKELWKVVGEVRQALQRFRVNTTRRYGIE